MQIQCKIQLKQLQRGYWKLDMEFEANKEYMENLSLQLCE